jgi:hypothetical protein
MKVVVLRGIVVMFAWTAGCSPSSAPPPPVAPAACVVAEARPPVEVPWPDVAALCSAPHGTPWQPPAFAAGDQAGLEIRAFVRDERYKQLGWLHDADWRMTGPFEGCACPPGSPPGCVPGVNKGPHPAVRIYYSPEVIDWMCTYRRGEHELANAPAMPDGAMIIKEMIAPDLTRLALIPGSNKLWIAPRPGAPADAYDRAYGSWTILIKDHTQSADGWYWAYADKTSPGNPPVWDRGAFTQKPYPGMAGAPVTSPPSCQWLPTFWQYKVADVAYPNAQFGSYCMYCHASAQGESTFASFRNLLGTELTYDWRPASTRDPGVPEVDSHTHEPVTHTGARAANACADNPFPLPTADPLPGWRAAFPALDPSYPEVWASRLPAQTYDHAVSRLGAAGGAPAASQFLTSDQCEACHAGGGADQLTTPNMIKRVGDAQVDLTPWAEWSVSPMGLAGRDPVFHSQLELERNLARGEPGLADLRDCIDNTCLHCHAGAGARQHNIDTAGHRPAGDRCKAFLPPAAERRAADYDGQLYTQRMVMAWRDDDPAHARGGALGRDGVTCTICHHIADEDLDPANLAKTFTGNFRDGPPDRVFGPFPNAASRDAVRTRPMVNALGITPEVGAHLARSEMCGTCHTVRLPVFDAAGKLAGAAYEQTTYLEWLLGNASTRRSCQDCHMASDFHGAPLTTAIANIQGTAYPAADFLMPPDDVDLPARPYRRHTLFGLNVWLTAFAQQYPLLLGVRQQDYMNPKVTAPLITGLATALEVARRQTATVALGALTWRGDDLIAPVTVTNLSGHALPSGVGFRRLFLEVEVLGAHEEPLWASGRTNALGVIVHGRGDEPLATEQRRAGPDGLPFQPHRQVITGEDQVQIYEELTQSQQLAFTTSFLHRYWVIKDNRLRPAGWNPRNVADAAQRAEYAAVTQPGTGPERNWWPRPAHQAYRNPAFPAIDQYTDTRDDPDYAIAAHPDTGLPGTDQVTYQMQLSPEARRRARRVRVTLYSQSAPPQFLDQRFAEAARPGAEREAAQRLDYMAGHLDTAAVGPDGAPYLTDYRLQVGEAAVAAVTSDPR